MRVSLRQLEALGAIFETGSASAAAAQLGVSQPAISRILAESEERLGLPLFRRHHNRLEPTTEMRALMPGIAKVFTEVEALRRDVGELREERESSLVVAATPALGFALLHPAIMQLRESRDVRVTVRQLINHEVAEEVHSGRAAFGLTFSPTSSSRPSGGELGSSRLVCVMQRDHPLAGRAAVCPRDLVDYPLISFEGNLPIGKLLDKAFESYSLKRRIAISVGFSLAACDLAIRGAGIAVIDEFTANGAAAATLIQRPFRPASWLAVRLIFQSSHPPTPLADALAANIRNVLEGTRAYSLDPPNSIDA